jgi:AcrR family transcriptional regulator
MATVARTDKQPRTRLDPDSRRAAILEAAAEAFASQPYADVPISDIARRAGASDALLYRYFAGKENLYAEIVQLAIRDLLGRQAAALDALPPGASVRDRLRETTSVYLDHIESHPTGWVMPLRNPGPEPSAATAIRREAREDYVERLRTLLNPSSQARHEYALWGFFGFLDAACLQWVQIDCPVDDRQSLIDAALGALEGALGDWAA